MLHSPNPKVRFITYPGNLSTRAREQVGVLNCWHTALGQCNMMKSIEIVTVPKWCGRKSITSFYRKCIALTSSFPLHSPRGTLLKAFHCWLFVAASMLRINYSVLSVVKGSSVRKSHFLCSWFLLCCWLRILLNTSILVTGYLLHRKFNGSKSRYKVLKLRRVFDLAHFTLHITFSQWYSRVHAKTKGHHHTFKVKTIEFALNVSKKSSLPCCF